MPDAPRQVTGIAEGVEDTPLTFSLGLFAADPDDLDNPLAGLTFEMVAQPVGSGTITIDGQSATFEPTTNFFGTTTFEFSVSDGSFTEVLTGTIVFSGVDDPPAAGVNLVEVNEDETTEFSFRVYEVDGDATQIEIISGPSEGVLNQLGDNLFEFTPQRITFGPRRSSSK